MADGLAVDSSSDGALAPEASTSGREEQASSNGAAHVTAVEGTSTKSRTQRIVMMRGVVSARSPNHASGLPRALVLL